MYFYHYHRLLHSNRVFLFHRLELFFHSYYQSSKQYKAACVFFNSDKVCIKMHWNKSWAPFCLRLLHFFPRLCQTVELFLRVLVFRFSVCVLLSCVVWKNVRMPRRMCAKRNQNENDSSNIVSNWCFFSSFYSNLITWLVIGVFFFVWRVKASSRVAALLDVCFRNRYSFLAIGHFSAVEFL